MKLQHSFLSSLLGLLLLVTASFGQVPQPVQLFGFLCLGRGPSQTCPDGARPDSIIRASDGNFYGFAEVSMDDSSNPQGGTLFKLTPAGQISVLHTFSAGQNNNFPTGTNPGFLVEGPDGNLYGSAVFGGAHSAGVFFRANKTGTRFRIIHSFCSASHCADGSFPDGVVVGPDGNIYGSTEGGGNVGAGCGSNGCGTIFKFSVASHSFATLHRLDGSTDGAVPSLLTLATDGNFYGVDQGANVNSNVFRITTDGSLTVTASFPEFTTAISGITQGHNGNLYGVAHGLINGIGQQVFEVGLDGSNLQFFPQFARLVGVSDVPNLLLASDGNLWEVTAEGGTRNQGTILTLSPNNGSVLQTISFRGSNGGFPEGQLIQTPEGIIVGTATLGGTVSTGSADGVVFTLNANLPPPIK